MSLLAVLAPILGDVVKGIFPDKEAEQKAQAQLQAALINRQKDLENAAAGVVQAEASSKHWLAANWRPILMLTFGGLIVARWFGWAAPNLSDAEYLALWDIVELGIGGYVIGRTIEKAGPSVAGRFAEALSRNKNNG